MKGPRRPCRECGELYPDPGPGKRDAPAGYCTVECHKASRPVKEPRAVSGPRRTKATTKRRAISPAAPVQREKVRTGACLVTGWTDGVDPAHLWPRGMGGCDSPLCVVPLRRDIHEALDRGEFDLLPHLIAHGCHQEIAHAVEHARGDLVAVLQRLTGERWKPAA